MLLRYRSAVGLPTIMEPDHHTTAFCVNCKSSLCCCPPLCQPESLTSSWSRNRSCSLPSLLTPSGLITSCRTHHGVPTASSEIKVHLNQAALWRKFNAVGTEMILTSAGRYAISICLHTGLLSGYRPSSQFFCFFRRMFPTIDLTVSGLEKDALYSMELEIRRADENRYKYTNSRWIPMGKSDAELPESILPYLHPDSPNTGSSWMKNTTSFKTIKLTNNPNNKHVRNSILVVHPNPYLSVTGCSPFHAQIRATIEYHQAKPRRSPISARFHKGTNRVLLHCSHLLPKQPGTNCRHCYFKTAYMHVLFCR